jgi:hypothetical protein
MHKQDTVSGEECNPLDIEDADGNAAYSPEARPSTLDALAEDGIVFNSTADKGRKPNGSTNGEAPSATDEAPSGDHDDNGNPSEAHNPESSCGAGSNRKANASSKDEASAGTANERTGTASDETYTANASDAPQYKNNAARAACEYLDLNIKVHPAPTRSKAPIIKDWQTYEAERAELDRTFKDHSNIGAQLGERSNGICDVDCDWPEFSYFADHILYGYPSFGRATSLRSHRIVRVTDKPKTKKFELGLRNHRAIELGLVPQDADEKKIAHAQMVGELRGTGEQTIFPPSIHEGTGEAIAWTEGTITENISRVHNSTYEEAVRKVGLVSFLAVMARFYPAQGIRQYFCMAVVGALLDAEYTVLQTEHYIKLLAQYTNDEQWADRVKTVAGTARKSDADKKYTGLPTACNLVHISDLTPKLREWLTAKEDALMYAIDRFNNEWSLVNDTVTFYQFSTGEHYTKDKFLTLTANETVTAKNGKEVELAKAWLKSKYRRSHARLAFKPDEGPITRDDAINLFKGFPIKPVKGDVTSFKELLEHVCGADASQVAYLTSWFAHILQRPWIKHNTMPFILSQTQGTGKSLLISHYLKLLGPYGIVIDTEIAKDKYNGYLEGRLLVVIEESRSTEALYYRMKNQITGNRITIRKMNTNPYEIENYANMLCTSNRTDGTTQEDGDRRVAPIRTVEEKLGEVRGEEFAKWWQKGGDAYTMHYLMHYDLRGFNPKSDALDTELKKSLMRDNRNALQRVIYGLKRTAKGNH